MSTCTACSRDVQHTNEVTDLCHICDTEVANRAKNYQISLEDALALWEAWIEVSKPMSANRALLISDAYARACQKGWHTAAAGALKALRGE